MHNPPGSKTQLPQSQPSSAWSPLLSLSVHLDEKPQNHPQLSESTVSPSFGTAHSLHVLPSPFQALQQPLAASQFHPPRQSGLPQEYNEPFKASQTLSLPNPSVAPTSLPVNRLGAWHTDKAPTPTTIICMAPASTTTPLQHVKSLSATFTLLETSSLRACTRADPSTRSRFLPCHLVDKIKAVLFLHHPLPFLLFLKTGFLCVTILSVLELVL